MNQAWESNLERSCAILLYHLLFAHLNPTEASYWCMSTVANTGRTLIGVRFMRVSKLYHFDASGHPVQPGDRVIVETTRGRQLGEVVNFVEAGKGVQGEGGYKAIEGIASPRDLAQQHYWQ